jgi:hypothetical protein
VPVCVWVYRDARPRYDTFLMPLSWAVMVFLALIVFLPAYLLFRPAKREITKEETHGSQDPPE